MSNKNNGNDSLDYSENLKGGNSATFKRNISDNRTNTKPNPTPASKDKK